MTDYLINQYNDKIAAALEAKDAAIAAAVQTWLEASAGAAIELAAALEHRNRVYVEGPPVISPPSTEPNTVEMSEPQNPESVEPTRNEFGVFGSVEPIPGIHREATYWKVSDIEPTGVGERE